MIIAAIDIGSNAARLQITKIIEFEGLITFKKLQYIRYPLRLGKDAFQSGRISKEKIRDFVRLMHVFRHLMDLYKAQHFYGCATSAMREANNSSHILEIIKNETGVEIEVISGKREAELISEVIRLNLDERAYLHIDVGGGSTELNLYFGQKKIASKSFKVGSVRQLTFTEHTNTWQEIISWLNTHVNKDYGKVTAIGTGGNITKLFELSSVSKSRKLTLMNLMKTKDYLNHMSFEDKINRLQLNPDRADVIVPACEIYIEIMRLAKAKKIFVPEVGLKDGINQHLYQLHYPNKGHVVVKNR